MGKNSTTTINSHRLLDLDINKGLGYCLESNIEVSLDPVSKRYKFR